MTAALTAIFLLIRALVEQMCLIALLVGLNQVFLDPTALQPRWEQEIGPTKADPARAWHRVCTGMTNLYRLMCAGAAALGVTLAVWAPTFAFLCLFTAAPANFWLQRIWRQATRTAARGLAL